MQDWKKEFDEKFCSPTDSSIGKLNEAIFGKSPLKASVTSGDEIKSFIEELLEEERNRKLEFQLQGEPDREVFFNGKRYVLSPKEPSNE